MTPGKQPTFEQIQEARGVSTTNLASSQEADPNVVAELRAQILLEELGATALTKDNELETIK